MWTPTLTEGTQLAAGILGALQADIESGRLKPGEQLPTHRELADHLKVALGTVTRAYALAQAQGLVTGTTGRGTFVTAASPAEQEGMIDLSRNLICRGQRDAGIRETLGAFGSASKLGPLLDEEQSPAGVPEHRAAAAVWMSRPGFTPAMEDIVITAGVQHAMHTILAAIAKPGDTVVTEALTYAGIRAIAALSGFQLRGLPVDSEGLDAQAFEDACKRGARILYTTPTLHSPTAITMSEGRRREIARIAETYGASILEDDVYGFLAPEAPAPIAVHAPANTYHMLGTSKSIACGLRVAYAVCPRGMQPRIADAIRTTIWEISPLLSALATKWIEDGAAERTIAFKRAEVSSRNDLAKRILPHATPPLQTSSHWWIPLPPAWRAADLVEECRKHGVAISPAAAFAIDRDNIPNAVRICLGAVTSRQRMQEGLEILKDLLDRGPSTHFTTT